MNATCSREAEILELHGDVLAPRQARELEQHLEACGHCRSMVEDLRALDALLAAPRAGEADGDGAFLASLATIPEREPARPAAGRLLQLTGAIAAVCVIAFVARARLSSETGETEDAGRTAPVREVAEMPEPTDADEPLPELVDADAFARLSIPTLHRLARGSDAEEARGAIKRLAFLQRSESLPALRDALRMPDRRLPAIAALGALGDERAVASLAPFLREETSATAAREALVRVGGAAAARALEGALGASEEAAERGLLLDAVAQVGGVGAIEQLGSLLAGTEAKVAEQVLLRHEARLAPYAVAGLSSTSRGQVEASLRVLGVIDAPLAAPVLGRMLSSRSYASRAAKLLVRMDSERATEVLWASRPTGEVRQAFRRAGPRTERWLLQQVDKGDARARRLAIDLLGFCGSAKAVEHMLALVDRPALAPGILACLGRLGSDEAVAALVGIAQKSTLRKPAIQSLGMTGSLRAVAPLLHLAENDRSVRTEVRRALAAIPCSEAVEAIVGLDDGSGSLRTTERALRGMDRELVLTTLDSLLDKDPPLEGRLAVTTRRVRNAVGGPVGAVAPRVALN